MEQLQEQQTHRKRFDFACDNILLKAFETGLDVELFYSAFKHKEQFPTASLLECLQVGADEWDL
jgi:hypothetical protein